MKIAILGGGINGVMTAWELCKAGHDVTLFEKNKLMQATSSSSTKLLHGGLRYLENYEFGLIKEALKDRAWWIKKVPELAHPIKIFIPIYKQSRRSAWLYRLGLFLYDFIAGKEKLGAYKKYNKKDFQKICPELKTHDLLSGFSFFDGQMDDYNLGMWAAEQLKKFNKFKLNENTLINRVSENGLIYYKNTQEKFDKVINITGPWAGQLLKDSNINLEFKLDLVRGSHIIIDKKIDNGYFLEVPKERRIFFTLPYKRQTLIGTTEIRQTLFEKVEPSKSEISYLIHAYNNYFVEQISKKNIVKVFSGLRLLVKSSENPNKATRENGIQFNKNLISVFGGKWTTARQLAIKISKLDVLKK